MNFTQVDFWIFVSLSFFSFILAKDHYTKRISYLVLISLFFYYLLSSWFVIFLIFSILWTFIVGNLIDKHRTTSQRLGYLCFGILVVLSFLIYYKYSYLIADTINYLFGTRVVVFDLFSYVFNELFHKKKDFTKILVPAGISFFVLHEISYLVDVYKNKIKACTNLIDYALYVSFFPQLISGPIVRANDFMPQMKKPWRISHEDFGFFTLMVSKGLIKKIVISDLLARLIVNRVFANPIQFSGLECFLATISHAMLTYCDFSGYTDIAIGISRLFGYKLPVNFNYPFKAQNVEDYWRRWHISFSSWLKDYIYIPLGGSRGSEARTQINLFITMVVSSVWHGAGWHIVFWGVLNGIGLNVFRTWKKLKFFNLQPNRFIGVCSTAITVLFIAHTSIFIRVTNFNDGLIFLKNIFFHFNSKPVVQTLNIYSATLLILFVSFSIHFYPDEKRNKLYDAFIQARARNLVCVLLVIFLGVVFFQSKGTNSFVYTTF